jgi:hypothetical protein
VICAENFDAMEAVNQSVQDAISNGGIAALIVALSDRNLPGENRLASLITVTADFRKVGEFDLRNLRHFPHIDEQHFNTG